MGRGALPVLLLLAVVASSDACRSHAVACGCSGDIPVLQSRDLADVVFAGRVVAVSTTGARIVSPADSTKFIAGLYVRYVLVVDKAWKGARADTAVVYSFRDLASCGFAMEPDQQYLLYANTKYPEDFVRSKHIDWVGDKPKAAFLTVSLCLRNRRLQDASEDVVVLGEPLWQRAADKQ